MNIIDEKKSLLLIIDVQEKLVNMLKDENVKEQAIKLAKAAGILNIPAIITEQYPKGLGETTKEIKDALPGAKYIEKTSFSAFEEIKEALNEADRKQIIIFGIETHICVLQTAFNLIDRGYEVYVVKNASGSRNEDDKNSALQRLRHAGCQTVTTEMVIFELLKTSKHPNFKEVQSLIK